MRSRYNDQLIQLNDRLIEMGAVAENAIAEAKKALLDQDVAVAQRIIDSDDEIDRMEKEIEGMCLKLLLQQQPVAGDLRLVSSILKIITDLERIGDHASDISEFTIALAGGPYIKNLEHIPQMAEMTMKMVSQSIEAYTRRDLALAEQVMEQDDAVDEIFRQVKRELIHLVNEDAEKGDQAIDLLMIAKYFERIGDHATNVAEWVEFSLTGVHRRSRATK
ncbi:MAG: phosphate signaling complex protein PhoU [Defluviitaleaceae bacterium]|nr:phosphate signaling complex protein PhoU [Defluviitaleaceae bacterium]